MAKMARLKWLPPKMASWGLIISGMTRQKIINFDKCLVIGEDCIIANFLNLFQHFGQLLYSSKPAWLKWVISYKDSKLGNLQNSNILMNILDIIVMREMRLNTQLDIIQTSNESTIYEQIWQFLILYKWDCFWSIKECGDFDFEWYNSLREELLVINARVTS